MKIKIKKERLYKKRDLNIKLISEGYFRPKIIKNKKKYNRKIKHKNQIFKDY